MCEVPEACSCMAPPQGAGEEGGSWRAWSRGLPLAAGGGWLLVASLGWEVKRGPGEGQRPGLTQRSVLVSWGSCNKVPQTRWLKTTEVYSFTVLDVRVPNQFSWTKAQASAGP